MYETETRTGLRIGVRTPWASDDPYVLNSAIRTLRLAPQYKRVPAEAFFETIGERFRQLWDRDSGRMRLIACLPEDPDFIVGFAMGDPEVPLLDYVHVRGGFTGQGVATQLLWLMGIDQDTHAAITFETRDYLSRRSWPLLLPAR